MDPRTHRLGVDRWLTDSRAYNLVWLGRWIERAQTIARVLLWAAEQESGHTGAAPSLEAVAEMAASVRGVSVPPGESALDALLTRDSGASLRGCLAAAQYNATQVAPVEVLRIIGAAIHDLDALGRSPDDVSSGRRAGPPPSVPSPPSAEEVIAIVRRTLATLGDLHESVETAWFHTKPLSEEEVYRRFVQQ